MKPERAFIAERAAAQHCPELLRAGRPPADLLPQLAHCGEALAAAFAAALQPLLGGEVPGVQAEPPSRANWDYLASAFAPLAANSVLGIGSGNAPMLLSLDAAPILRMLDLAFGGKGEAPPKLPDVFPMSAELMIARLEGRLIEAMRAVFAGPEEDFIRPLRRDGRIDLLKPFASDTPTVMLRLSVSESPGARWAAMLVFPLATLSALLGPVEFKAPVGAAGRRDPAALFGGVPLSLRAVLVDMAMPVAAIAALAPGTILPVAVARNVPLRIGSATVAHGTIGTLDERVAVQITHAFLNPQGPPCP